MFNVDVVIEGRRHLLDSCIIRHPEGVWLIDQAQDFLTEFELSSQDHGEVRSLVFLISIADPYVPPIIKKKPETITKILKVTIAYHLVVLGLCQLS